MITYVDSFLINDEKMANVHFGFGRKRIYKVIDTYTTLDSYHVSEITSEASKIPSFI